MFFDTSYASRSLAQPGVFKRNQTYSIFTGIALKQTPFLKINAGVF
jgi:hypothetical protein